MSTIFRCNICLEDFTEKRALVNHEKNSRKHRTKAGESIQSHTCEPCGRQFSRKYDIGKHQRQGQCRPGVATAARQMVNSNKRKHDADDSEDSNPRKRTTSPARIDSLGDSDLRLDTSNHDTMSPWIPEQGGAEAIPTSQEPSQNVDESGTTTSHPLPHDAAAQYGAVDTNVSTVDVLADIDLDGVQENTYLPPPTDIGAAGNIATSAPASPDHQLNPELQSESEGGQEVQILPVNNSVDGISAAGAVESLTNAFKRTSIDAKRRASLCLSTITGYSAVSRTNSSARSLFNPSLKIIRLSWLSGSSQRTSNGGKRASTVPSEMAGTMLEPIDEELANSRLESWVLHPNKARQERLWIALRKGSTEDVADVLTSWIGSIDVNRPDDYGWTPLITATYHGHGGIVALLLGEKAIDVSYKDTTGYTASMYARLRGYSKIEKMFTEHKWYLGERARELETKVYEQDLTSRRYEKRRIERGPYVSAHKRLTRSLRQLAE